MTKAVFIKRMGALAPEGEDACALMATIKLGDAVMVEIKRPRNIGHHRKYWALINLVYQNQEHFQTPEKLHTAIKYAIGHTETVKTKSGIHEYPLPTDFGKMDQVKFAEFYDRAVDFIVGEVMPGIGRDELLKEAEAFSG